MENFDMNRFLKIFWNSKFYIAFILLLCLAIGYFYSYYYVTPMYQSSATVVLVQNENLEQEVANDSSITQTDITLNKNLLSTYTKIAKSNKVLEKVIEDLNLDMTPSGLAGLVSVQAVNNTQVFKISVSNKDKELAPVITNHLLEVFSQEVRSLYHMNNIYTMDFAEVSNTPYNINHTKDLAIFVMIGFVLSFGLVVVFYLFDNTIKSEKDIEEYSGLSVLSTIPIYTNKSGKQNSELIVNEQPKSPISECFKTFRTNVMFSIQNKKLNTILVTSGFMGEGKSFVSSNLAVAFASSGKKVILVDTDMRKGRVHKIFNLSNEQGLSTCLAKIGTNGSLVNINDFIKESNISNLHVMTSGIVPPNPSELLSSSNMIRLLEALNRQYDIVICDGTPCMLVSDSIILSKIVDTTVIVTANKTTKLDTLLKIKKSIEMVGGNIGGAVINKMDVNEKSYQNSYYYGSHGESQNKSIDSSFEHDTVLDTPLYIKELEEVILHEEPKSDVKENICTDTNTELTTLSESINENTKQINELRNLYQDVMQDTLKLATKPDSSKDILEELENIKNYYHDISLKQALELENVSKKQEEQFDDIYSKIDNIELPDNSQVILEELQNFKNDYQDTAMEQYNQIQDMSKKYEEQIDNINHKIDNLELTDNSQAVLEELQNLKNDYQDTAMEQYNQIQDMSKKYEEQIDNINHKIDNLELTDNSQAILEELQNLKNDYQDTAIEQYNQIQDMSKKYEEQISNINNKVDNIELPDNSQIIMEELDNLKSSYNDRLHLQMETMNKHYENILKLQNEKFDELYKQMSTSKDKEDSNELLNQVVKIYHQLESMNSKFESLEQRASHNELLIKNLSNEVKNSLYQPTRSLDIDKLNHKVIQIQDYLEKSTQSVNDVPSLKNGRKNKAVLDGQMSIIDDLLDKAELKQQYSYAHKNPNFVVDYESVKRKQERKGFAFFKNKTSENIIDEEPITIVSQILSNRNESVS
ncbi:MAG: polysaccharide biosynthesis tyrosine autokinase [Clostridia bacterium]|nr:polysaccharide biosynthesis tyrosine autokinase [Clostridia bacterium]